ncbi:hypothetical protein FA15DRAFT_634213 [Coprinopsis marcescibilis]|uniref:Uncharacterized protein n=1 Tax=Coprinopsis marcescibilis TaxID=230819 RepID=A0A5C3L5L6_COPMA|nr:hypothetical protein FA15DRAFT_634213 [Coprinopsis marcescibilis]
MSIMAHLPILQLVHDKHVVPPFLYPKERHIDLKVLIDICPDREDYLHIHSIADIRADLKLRPVGDKGPWEWLYQSIGSPVLSGTTVSASNDEDDEDDVSVGCKINSPRLSILNETVLSAKASARRIPVVPWVQHGSHISLESLNLTVHEALISPRQLGPTHILVAYESRPRRASGRICEMPINDFLFAMNVPNLAPRKDEDGASLPPIPRRIHGDLHRVLIAVPHLLTFPELVVYLHNKNQAELFRKIVPQWIHDIMHPLPSISPRTEFEASLNALRGTTCSWFAGLRRFNPFRSGKPKVERSKPLLNATDASQRTISSIARELEATARTLREEQLIVSTTVGLNALRENLQFVGYFDVDLWLEMDTMRGILMKAVTSVAKV